MTNLESIESLNLPLIVECVPFHDGHTLLGNISRALGLVNGEVSIEINHLVIGDEIVSRMVDVTVESNGLTAKYDYFPESQKLLWAH